MTTSADFYCSSLPFQGVEFVPLGRLACCYTLWGRPGMSITSTLTSILGTVYDHVSTLTTTEAGISAPSAFCTVISTTLSTSLLLTLHLPYIAPLGFCSASSRCCIYLRVRNPRTLFPLLEFGVVTDAKIISMASMAGTCLILRPRPPNITYTSPLSTVLYLLDMHH